VARAAAAGRNCISHRRICQLIEDWQMKKPCPRTGRAWVGSIRDRACREGTLGRPFVMNSVTGSCGVLDVHRPLCTHLTFLSDLPFAVCCGRAFFVYRFLRGGVWTTHRSLSHPSSCSRVCNVAHMKERYGPGPVKFLKVKDEVRGGNLRVFGTRCGAGGSC
jgi:hypothetical protein